MKLGLALSVLDLEPWGQRRLADVVAEIEWAEDVGFDSVWISDHYFMSLGGSRAAGLEPLTTLSYAAARTSRITLGTLVLCNNFRNVGQLARELGVLVEAADGRLVIGLGCGAQEAEHDAFGLPYAYRVSRLEESLEVLPRLLEGETVSYDGRLTRLADASFSSTGRVPPFWVAAFRPRMIGIAARLAQGWASNWNGPDPSTFADNVAVVRGAIRDAGRDDESFDFVACMLVAPHTGDGADVVALAERLMPGGGPIEERVVFGDATAIAGVLESYRDVGATHAILAPAPRQFSRFAGADRDEVAAVVRAFSRTATPEGSVTG
jgi:alkanesulfonate monooxygenase SsuD/methylene tetrahydromethanopterin reductase-like flavin-dependent oxidoreductase (luciferase family)